MIPRLRSPLPVRGRRLLLPALLAAALALVPGLSPAPVEEATSPSLAAVPAGPPSGAGPGGRSRPGSPGKTLPEIRDLGDWRETDALFTASVRNVLEGEKRKKELLLRMGRFKGGQGDPDAFSPGSILARRNLRRTYGELDGVFEESRKRRDELGRTVRKIEGSRDSIGALLKPRIAEIRAMDAGERTETVKAELARAERWLRALEISDGEGPGRLMFALLDPEEERVLRETFGTFQRGGEPGRPRGPENRRPPGPGMDGPPPGPGEPPLHPPFPHPGPFGEPPQGRDPEETRGGDRGEALRRLRERLRRLEEEARENRERLDRQEEEIQALLREMEDLTRGEEPPREERRRKGPPKGAAKGLDPARKNP